MLNKRSFWAVILAASMGLSAVEYQAPPLQLLEDENSEVEQPLPQQTSTPKEEEMTIPSNNTTTKESTYTPAPKPQPISQGGLILIDEDEEAARIEAERKAAEEAARIEAENPVEDEPAPAAVVSAPVSEEPAVVETVVQEEPQASAPKQNAAEDEREDKMLDALLEAQKTAQQATKEALRQAAKADSILQLQRQQEERLKQLERNYNNNATLNSTKSAAQPQAQPQTTPKEEKPVEKETLLKRYYRHNGQNSLSIVSAGYSTYFLVGEQASFANSPAAFAFKRHILNFEVFEWRAKCFGMQMFNFEMGINTPMAGSTNNAKNIYKFERGGANSDERIEATAKTMWFAYKPAVKFYIPCTKWLAVELYGGVEVDVTQVWNFVNSSYYSADKTEALTITKQNFFFGAYGGAGLMFTPLRQIPIELKAEYRQPLRGNTALVPQGVYISLQLHLAVATKKIIN